MAEHNLTAQLGLDISGFNAGLEKAQGSLEKTGKKMSSIGKGLTAGVTAPLMAIAGLSTKTALDFDEAMDSIRAGTGATGEALKGLGDTFKNVMKSVPTDVATASQAIADLNTRTGQTGEGLEKLTEQLLNVSRLTNTDINANIASTTRLFGDWSIATDKQSSTLDYLFKVSQSTGISFTSLSQKMVQFGAPLRQMGFDFDTSAALMGKWEKEGVNSELVLNSMRIALAKMAQEGVTNANEALTIMIERIQNAGSVGERNALAIEMFGSRAGPDMAAAIYEGRFAIDDLVKDLQSSSETINQATLDTMGFDERMGILKNTIGMALLPLGEQLISIAEKSLLPMLEKAINFVSGLTDKFDKLPEPLQNTILGFGGIAAAVGPALMALGGFLPMIDGIKKALLSVSATSWTTMGIIGGLILGATLIYQNWDKISAFLSKTWNSIKSTAENIWGGVEGFFEKTWSSIKNTTETTWNKISGFFSNTWKNISENTNKFAGDMKNYIGSQMKEVENITKTSLSLVKNLFSGNWEGIKEDLSKIWDSIRKMFDNFLRLIANALGINFEDLKKIVYENMTAIKDIFSKAWEKIFVDTIKWVENLIKDIANWFKKLPGMIWDNIKDIGETIAKPFKYAFDIIVGHSIVPELVGQVAYWFNEMSTIMGQLSFEGVSKVLSAFENIDVSKLKGLKEFFDFISEWKVLDVGQITNNFKNMIQELGALGITLLNEVIKNTEFLKRIGTDLKSALLFIDEAFKDISLENANRALNELKTFFDYLNNWISIDIKKVFNNFHSMITELGALGILFNQELQNLAVFVNAISLDLRNAFAILNKAFEGITTSNITNALKEIKDFIDVLTSFPIIDVKKFVEDFKTMITSLGEIGIEIRKLVTGDLVINLEALRDSFVEINKAFEGAQVSNLTNFLKELTELISQLEILGTKSISNVKASLQTLFRDIYDIFVSKEWQGMKENILQTIGSISSEIKLGIFNLGKEIEESYKNTINVIQAKVNEALTILKPQLAGYSEYIKDVFVADTQVIKNEWVSAIDIVKSATNEFKQQIDEMLNFLKAVVTGEGIDSSQIMRTFEFLEGYVSDLVNRLYESIFKPILEEFANALMKIPEAIETTLMHMMDIAQNKLVGMIADLAKYFTETWWGALQGWLRMWENAFKDFMSKANQFKSDFLSWLRKFIFDINLAFTDLINPFQEWAFYLNYILTLLAKMKQLLENMPKIPSPPVIPGVPGPEPQSVSSSQSFSINHLEVKTGNAQELVDELVKLGRLYAY
ncbi:MAG: phage tail tape measure protein [Candidatus Cloacimonetes bacterium]|nr:phage tail tape measure protein [Candidatus Cloacimonadota bacterium]